MPIFAIVAVHRYMPKNFNGMATSKPTLISVVGPTAIGKTALAIKIANHFSTEILSADSRQFYKEMKIGTAVPSTEELAAAPHHFIQHKSIFDTYTVGDFERETLKTLDGLFREKDVMVLVGGSGLYVKAVNKGLDKFPDVPSHIRNDLNIELETKGIKRLQTELKEVDPEQFSKIDQDNPRRVIRALEVYRASGKPYSSYLNKSDFKRNFNSIYVGLTADRAKIYDRINQRVDFMMTEGLLEEAKKLHPNKNLNALQTVGYRELFEYFEGKRSLEETVSEIKKNTRRFAKRQLTWFKKNEDIQWFDYDTPPEEIIAKIKAKNAL